MSAPEPAPKPLPNSLKTEPRIGSWLRILPEGSVEVFSGKVEIGQGILTALAEIVARELDVRIERIRMIAASTDFSPNEGLTAGSQSVQASGGALRQASAEARAIYLQQAAAQLDCPATDLAIIDGDIIGPGNKRTSYWALAENSLLDVMAAGIVAAKPLATLRDATDSAPRLDLPDKIFGRPRYMQDLHLPALMHGRILRLPNPRARLVSIDAAAVSDEVSIVRDGSLLGVLAATERAANAALASLNRSAVWDIPPEALPDETDLPSWLKAQQAESTVTRSSPANGAAPAHTLRAAYSKPYLSHASIATCCAVARFDGEKLEVWSHSQGIYSLRRDLALAFEMPEDAISVHHVEGAGCYGHNAADDAAFDAAFLARAAAGRPVRVLWSRQDELTAAPFGPPMLVEMEADLDEDGAIQEWRHAVWSNGHSWRPGRGKQPSLLGYWQRDPLLGLPAATNPPSAGGGGADRNAIPIYGFPAWQVTHHHVPNMPLRVSALRSLGAFANVFAAESFLDEIATQTGRDPLDLRLHYATDPRAKTVIAHAAEHAGWHDRKRLENEGIGIAFARYKNTSAYCAVIAEIVAEEEIRVRRLTLAVDAGAVITADGVINQIEGGAIQATSWTLKEAVRFDREKVTSDSWETYPILRFAEIPKVDVHIIPSMEPSLGVGECSVGPTAAAIGNAVFNALGLRIRDLPMTPERIIAAMS